jgi:alpha-amylase
MGNELQTAAVSKLYSLSDRVGRCGSDQLTRDWVYLQSSDHFYYMSTKFFSDGAVHAYFNPYENPYQAFMNYMNVLSDFEIRLNIVCPVNDHDTELNRLSASIELKDHLISELQQKLTKYEKKGRVAKPGTVRAGKGRSTKAAVKKVTPEKVTPEKVTPKKGTAKKITAKKVTPKKTAAKSVRAGKATK